MVEEGCDFIIVVVCEEYLYFIYKKILLMMESVFCEGIVVVLGVMVVCEEGCIIL